MKTEIEELPRHTVRKFGLILVLACVVFALVMLTELSAIGLTAIVLWPLIALLALGALALFVTGIVWLVFAFVRNRGPWCPLGILVSASAIVAALFFCPFVFSRQDAANQQNGERLVNAVERYFTDHGSYPAHLADLTPKYLPTVPHWRWGIWSIEYVYWTDPDGDRCLKYVENMGLVGKFYYFNDKQWRGDAVW
jgi:hypothetical protein